MEGDMRRHDSAGVENSARALDGSVDGIADAPAAFVRLDEEVHGARTRGHLRHSPTQPQLTAALNRRGAGLMTYELENNWFPAELAERIDGACLAYDASDGCGEWAGEFVVLADGREFRLA
jgi:hypothetical protein